MPSPPIVNPSVDQPSTPPLGSISTPPSPSNPPSPSSPVDVPLLRLSPAARRVQPPTSENQRSMTDPNKNGLSASGFAQRERKQSNPLSQFRSTANNKSNAGGGSSRFGGGSRFGKGSSTGNSSRGKYDGSSVATGTTDGEDRDSEADLLGVGSLNSPNVDGSRGTSSRSRNGGARGRNNGNGGMPLGLGGRGESDGEFDEGWTGGLETEDEEEAGLLGGAGHRDSVSHFSHVDTMHSLTCSQSTEWKEPSDESETKKEIVFADVLPHCSTFNETSNDPI